MGGEDPMMSGTLDRVLDLPAMKNRRPYSKVVKARPHTPVYVMHKFWARRPHNVFSELIAHYSTLNDIILDPFCGGGVTVVEALRLRRRVVGVDVNPLATYVTKIEVRPFDVSNFWEAYQEMRQRVEAELSELYKTSCLKCRNRFAVFDWLEWEKERPLRMKYNCPKCGTNEKEAGSEDLTLSREIDRIFDKVVSEKGLWYPRVAIPKGDKTDGIISDGYRHFSQLFTRRNLLALSMLHKEISSVQDQGSRELLAFAFSSSLKWASKQSHLRGQIVEGWAMHAYWIYPRTLEINVWNTFTRRCTAVARGKEYSNKEIGTYFEKANSFQDLLNNRATCLILTQSSSKLPIPDESVDVVITDPPYGGNVNYGELSDYWMIWHSKDSVTDKSEEIIINKAQGKKLEDYEEGLRRVFNECFRVLKKGRNMVVTFNSKDSRVVASFVIAASRAGFVLHPQGLLYQPPIRAYTTTFHAMQIGAFTGDFVFTLSKPGDIASDQFSSEMDLGNFKEQIDGLIQNHIGEKITEPELRERTYRTLIPFLAQHAEVDLDTCRKAVDYFEAKMRKLEPHFKELRRRLTEERRRIFSTRQGLW